MSRLFRSLIVLLAAALAGLASLQAFAQAQTWPQKPVRIVVGNSPGSLSDVLSRQLFANVGQALGQSFIIDNRAGVGGAIGAEHVAKSAPDGYTLLFGTDGMMAINPFVYARLAYDPLRDFTPVSMIAKIPYVLLVNPALGAKSVEDFVRIAKSRPMQINYSSGGNGHATHLEMELLARKAGIQLVHVPYKGTGPSLQAVVSGEVSATAIGLGIAIPQIKGGKVLALFIGGPREKDVFPNVPTLAGSYPEAEYVSWQAVFAPAGTPKPVIDRLNGAIVKAMESPDTLKRMADMGMAPIGSSPADLDRELRANLNMARDLVKALKLKLD